jgi:uncharacterized membrane protein (UPF0127 family)
MENGKHFVARDAETGVVVANRVSVASRRIDRAVGLLSRSSLDPGEGLWITPCNGVHTWFMRFTIDVLALDADGVVVDVVSDLKPWRMRLPKPGAVSVLELPAGTLASAGMKVGHRITIEDRAS